jgi:hypothetical protein
MDPETQITTSGAPMEPPAVVQATAPSTISLLKPKAQRTIGDHLRNYVVELISICLWVYALLAILIYSPDRLLLGFVSAELSWIVNLKFVLIIVLVAAIWLWIGTRDIIFWFFYVVFYPLVLLFRFSYFVFKQDSWLLAFAIFNAIGSFFQNLKYRIIFSAIFFPAFLVALFATQRYYLLAALGVLTGLIVLTYFRAFVMALKPTVVFQIYSKFFKGIRKIAHTSFVLEAAIKTTPLELLDERQLAARTTNLQSSVLFNRACLFAAKKLRNYQKSEWKIVPAIFGLLSLVIFTVVGFSAIYLGMFKMFPAQFQTSVPISYFSFLYFSFNNFHFGSTPGIVSTGVVAQSFEILQGLVSFILVVIFATLLISHRAQKTSSELDEVIGKTEEEAASMEAFIQAEYGVPDIETAVEQLVKAKAGFVQAILWLTKGIV